MHTTQLFAFAAMLLLAAVVARGQTTVNSFGSEAEMKMLQARNTHFEQIPAQGAKGGHALKVEFLPSEWPSVLFTPSAPWDWSAVGGLEIEVTNPSQETLTFSIRVDDDLKADGIVHCRTGSGSLEPGRTATFLVPFGPDAMSVGMRALPAPAGARSMGAGGEGSFDLHHIVAFQVFMHAPTAAKDLILNSVRTVPRVDLNGIVDAFGQYTRSDWPGKLHTASELAARLVSEAADLKAHPVLPERDRFGGWAAGPKLNATGFFRTEKQDGKWWLVDPDGRLFLSFGFDTMSTYEDTFITGREAMFTALPSPNDPLARHRGYTSNIHSGPIKEGVEFNFYGANLERKYGPSFKESWNDATLARLPSWGFNTIGNWADDDFIKNGRVPYVATGGIGGDHARVSSGSDYWSKMHDPFDPKFAADVTVSVAPLAEKVKGDPWCLGYFVDNELSWAGSGDNGRYGLAIGALGAAAGSPAKAAFLARLQAKYHDIGGFNAAWGTDLADWNALKAPYVVKTPLNATQKSDLSAFVKQFALRYFQVIRDAIRKIDPDHLYLGCRFAWHCPEAVAAAAEVCDVVSFNIYSPRVDPKEWSFLADLNRPCIIGEFHFGALDRGMFHPGLVSTPNQEARAQMYRDYVRSVVDNPALVGCHWFQYVDEPLTGRTYDGENYNIGFVTVTDTPYAEMVAAAKEVHGEAYRRRASGVKTPF